MYLEYQNVATYKSHQCTVHQCMRSVLNLNPSQPFHSKGIFAIQKLHNDKSLLRFGKSWSPFLPIMLISTPTPPSKFANVVHKSLQEGLSPYLLNHGWTAKKESELHLSDSPQECNVFILSNLFWQYQSAYSTRRLQIYLEQIYTCIVLQRDLLMEENSNWVLEVEEALLDEAPPERIRVLLAGASSLW